MAGFIIAIDFTVETNFFSRLIYSHDKLVSTTNFVIMAGLFPADFVAVTSFEPNIWLAIGFFPATNFVVIAVLRSQVVLFLWPNFGQD